MAALAAGMVDRFAAHARLPVRVARGVGHHARAPVEADRDVFAGRRGQAVVAGDAAVGGLKMRAEGDVWFLRLRRLPASRRADAPTTPMSEQQRQRRADELDHRRVYQPSFKLPSAKSHSR